MTGSRANRYKRKAVRIGIFFLLSLIGSLATMAAIEHVYLDWNYCWMNWTYVPQHSPANTLSFPGIVRSALTSDTPANTLLLVGLEALPFAGFALVAAFAKSRRRRFVALALWAVLLWILFENFFDDPHLHHGCGQASPDGVFAFMFLVFTWPLAFAILLIPAEGSRRMPERRGAEPGGE